MKLLLIELNEINFEVAKKYISSGNKLNSFQKMIINDLQETSAEESYEHLEPWIQWPSIHTGLKYKEHNVFRLGDFVNCKEDQLFEKIENAGFKVGSISAMNATNRLKNPSYFIPDPWTETATDGSFLSKALSDAISQTVNDNSKSKITFKSIISLITATLVLVNPFKLPKLFFFGISSIAKPWRKALFLDLLLHEIHKTLIKRKNPDFSTIFYNAGAHIQHHYFFNSEFSNKNLKNPTWYIGKEYDPVLEMLKVYDNILEYYLNNPEYEVIIATGLSQKPFEDIKFYYRLIDHEKFLNKLGINYLRVQPRMSRDFLISFENVEDALICERILKRILVNNSKNLFGEVDNRGKDLFVVLTYPHEITEETFFTLNGKDIMLKDFVTFVAIKNGEHQSKGYAYFSNKLHKHMPKNNSHVSEIHNAITGYFQI